jgi:hypothetical protein
MKYDFEIQCPNCKEIINISSETKSNQDYHFSSCPHCGKKVKVRLGPELRADLKKSKTYSFESLTNIHPLEFKLGQVKPIKRDEPDTSTQEQHISTTSVEPIIEPSSAPESGTPLEHPDRREKIPFKSKYSQDNQKSYGRFRGYKSNRGFKSYKDNKLNDVEQIMYKPPKKKRERPIISPERRLKIAGILLIIVFVLGLLHGINSLLTGYITPITTEEDKPEYSDISGTIIDNRTGRPIKNCKIIVLKTGQTSVSNTDGQYFIPNVKAGIHRISADSSGYIKVIKRVTVDPELMGRINFELDEGIGNKAIDESITLTEQNKNEDVNIFSVLILIFAFFGIVSALLAFRRTFFLICSFCAFISIMSIGFFIGSFLAIIAFILIVSSTEGFERTPTLPMVDS